MMDNKPVNNDMQNLADTPDASSQVQPQSPLGPNKTGNKNLIVGIAIGLGLLLVTLAVLLTVLLMKKSDSSEGTKESSQSTQTSSNNSSKKEVLLTVPSSNEKLEYVIYKPKQNATNTTINFGVRNKCAGCSDTSSTYSVTYNFDSKENSYLLDENMGKKYSTIKDEDENVLASPTCSGNIKSGDTIDCFVAFSKVPSGSTVSWVFSNARIDGIKVE